VIVAIEGGRVRRSVVENQNLGHRIWILHASVDRAFQPVRGSCNWHMYKFSISILLFASTVIAQDTKPLADAGTTTCESANQGGGTGAWVTSKIGFSAAAELRAEVKGKDKERHCTTTWILHVRSRDGRTHSITVARREDTPDDNEWIQENSFEIKAWSPDGTMILVSQIETQGDWDETTPPIVYDFRTRRHWRVELHPLFEKVIPRDCYIVYRPLKFTDNGEVLISGMSTDDDREAGTNDCFGESLWRLNFKDSIGARVNLDQADVKKQ